MKLLPDLWIAMIYRSEEGDMSDRLWRATRPMTAYCTDHCLQCDRMLSMADHDKTVREARENMAEFDRLRVLERWLQNYVNPALGVPDAYWCTVTKDEKRWRVEYGLLSSAESIAWCHADPGAPEPPILEFRRPKPEPVKPRFNVPKPRHVDSFDRMRAAMDAAFNDALLYGTGAIATTATEVSEGLTPAKMRALLDDFPPDWRRPVRSPIYEPVHIGIDYGKESSYMALLQFLPPPKIPESTLRYLRDMASSLDLPDPPLPPSPEPSKRNQ